MHFIGIDIGTSSICGIIYNLSNKEIEVIVKDNNAFIESSHIWEKTQNTSIIYHLVTEIIDEFLQKYSDIRGIGFSGQMHGMLYVNKEGKAVSPLYTWQDERASQIFRDNKTYAKYLSEITGYPLATGFGLVTHFYNKENNIVPEDAVKLCTIMDYIVMKLCGRTTPLIDYSNAASLGLFDIKNLRFDTQALEKAGIDISVLPEANESATLAGFYNGIPVYSAIGDNQASFLGSVQDVDKSIHITVGTSSQISIYSDQYINIKPLDTRPFPGGGYILVGAALSGGQSFAILKNFFEETIKFFSDDIENIDYYKKMTSLGFHSENGDIPIVETLFAGTRAEPEKRGTIRNISTSNLTPENLIIGFNKGICDELFYFYNLIPEYIKKDKSILVASGNGIKRNVLLRKILEERFGYKVGLSPYQEESAFGACICAIVGGEYAKGFRNLSD